MRPMFLISSLLITYIEKCEAQEMYITESLYEPPEEEFRKLWNDRAMIAYLMGLQEKRRTYVSMEDLERIEKELIE